MSFYEFVFIVELDVAKMGVIMHMDLYKHQK
ncbi:unnamed protein product, partial [marine sediment metagenome]